MSDSSEPKSGPEPESDEVITNPELDELLMKNGKPPVSWNDQEGGRHSRK